MTRVLSVLLSLLAVTALAAVGLTSVAAQDATPGPVEDNLLPDLFGLPELQITLTDAGFEGVPAETQAGWTVVTFTAETADGGAVGFVQLPEGKTVDDLAAISQMAGEEGEASPAAMGDMASPAASQGEDPLAWIFQTYIAGGVGAEAGQTVQGIINLEPGNYAVWADDPFVPIPPVAMTVTENAMASPVAATEFGATATITEVGTSDGFDFQVSGQLQPGPQVIEIHNDSDQPHFVVSSWFQDPITEDEVMQFLMEEEGGTPEAEMGGTPPAESGEPPLSFYAAIQSAGTTQYIAANLQPGYHVLLCFVPDPTRGGVPHAFEGMIEVVPVGV